MIDYTFIGSSAEGPISGEVQQARTDVLNLQNSVNNANLALSNIWDNSNYIRQTVSLLHGEDKLEIEDFIQHKYDDLKGDIANTKSVILETLEQYNTTEENRFRDLYNILHSEISSIAAKVEYIEGVVNLIQTKLNGLEQSFNDFTGNYKVRDVLATIIHAVANMQRTTIQTLSTVPFEQKNFIENAIPYYLYCAVDDDPAGACSGDHTLLRIIEGTIGTVAAGVISVRSIASENNDLLHEIKNFDSEAAEDCLNIFCFVWENVLRLVFTDDIANYSGSFNLVKSEDGWESYRSDNASLPMVSRNLVRIPQKLVRYGYFKGVFPDQEQTYYYSEELSKILACPWRDTRGYGGSF